MMSDSLKNKVALVTGAGRPEGIGAAVARRLARDGAHVVLGDICAPPSDLPHAGSGAWEGLAAVARQIEEECPGVRALPVRLDVTDAASIQAAEARFTWRSTRSSHRWNRDRRGDPSSRAIPRIGEIWCAS